MMELVVLMIEYHSFDKNEVYLNLNQDLYHIEDNMIDPKLLIIEILLDLNHLEMDQTRHNLMNYCTERKRSGILFYLNLKAVSAIPVGLKM
jgi:hypothetical protein